MGWGSGTSERENVLRSFLRISSPACGLRQQFWLQRWSDTRMSFVWCLLNLGKHEIFSGISLVRKQGSCWEALSVTYSGLVINMQLYMTRVSGKIAFVRKFLVYRGEIKGSETFRRLILFENNSDSPRKHCASFSLMTRKCCYLLGKLRKRILVRNFLFSRTTKFLPVKLGTWRAVKTRACLLRFSALKGGLKASRNLPLMGTGSQ